MKKLLLALLLLAAPAFAQTKQSVQQSGNVTSGHLPYWVTSGVVGDGGSSSDSPTTSIGVTNNGGAGICVSSARQSAVGRNQLCLGASTSSPAVISLQNYGTAPAESLQFNINGALQGFPTVSPLPTTVGDLACFGTTGGGLKDCGTLPSTNPVVIGTTPITGGTPNGLLFDSAGAVGNLATANSGVLVTNGAGTPSISTTLPTGVALSTPASGVATNLTGTASGLTAGNVTTNANLTGDVTSSGNATTYNNVVPTTKGGAGLTTGALKGNGAGVVSQAACSDLSNGTGACSATYTSAGTFTPTDGSGASLSFTASGSYTQIGNMIFAYGQVTYPSTANGSNAVIAGLPVTSANQTYARQCSLSYTNIATFTHMLTNSNATTVGLYTAAGVAIANSVMSTGQLDFICIYPAT